MELDADEIKVIEELRTVEYGEMTIVKQDGMIMLTKILTTNKYH